jgi:hypothetical protein
MGKAMPLRIDGVVDDYSEFEAYAHKEYVNKELSKAEYGNRCGADCCLHRAVGKRH